MIEESTMPGEDPRPRFRVLYRERGEVRTWGWYTTRNGAEQAAELIKAKHFASWVEEWTRAVLVTERDAG